MKKTLPIRLNLAQLVRVSGKNKPSIYESIEDGRLRRNTDGSFTLSHPTNRKFLRELGLDPAKIKVPAVLPKGRPMSIKSGPIVPAGPGAEAMRIQKTVHSIIEIRQKTEDRRKEYVDRALVQAFSEFNLETSIAEYRQFTRNCCQKIVALFPNTLDEKMEEAARILDHECDTALSAMSRAVSDFWKKNPIKDTKKTLPDLSIPDHLNGVPERKLHQLSKTELLMLKNYAHVQLSRLKIQIARRELLHRRLVQALFGKLYTVDTGQFLVIPARTSALILGALGLHDEALTVEVDRVITEEGYATMARVKEINDTFIRSARG